MNVQPQTVFARFDGLDALAGYDDGDELAGIGKKLKKLRRKVGKVSRKIGGVNLFKKAIPKKIYAKARRVGQKAELFGKRNGVAIAGAVATVATGGAAAPALVAALQKTAASEAMRKIARKRGKKEQKKMIGKADAEADRQAAQYEAELKRQDAARATASTGGGGEPATATQDTEDTPKRSSWILPTLGIGAAVLALV